MQNALLMAEAMTAAHIPFELHIYPEGAHGQSLANEESSNGREAYCIPHLQGWIDLAIQWVRDFHYGE